MDVGAGSFERAEFTRCSSFCIFPIRPRIWWREDEGGRPGVGGWIDRRRLTAVRWVIDDVDCSWFIEIDGPREYLGWRYECWGRGVVFVSEIESRDFGSGIDGVTAIGSECSELGGDGGVGVSETVDEADFVGGVAIVGDEAVVG